MAGVGDAIDNHMVSVICNKNQSDDRTSACECKIANTYIYSVCKLKKLPNMPPVHPYNLHQRVPYIQKSEAKALINMRGP